SKKELGVVGDDVPVYEYSFFPPRPGRIDDIKPFPKIVMGASVHGGEGLAVASLYYLFERICNDWESDKTLEYLRHNINFVICPLRSPIDYTDKTYVNRNGVNINRNFDWGWDD